LSVVKRIIRDSKERMAVDELLSKEFEEAGYGGINLTKTPLGAQINLYTMRPGRVIGKRGRAIKDASEKLEKDLGLINPQITVVEIEVPELNPHIMAARVANALERGVHFRRSIFWSLRRIMDSGALGCEIILKGPIRSARARFEKVSEGYIPKAGEPSKRYLRHAVIHVKQKRGILGVTVNIVPPDAKFPDKISLKDLPEIEYPEEEVFMPEGFEPELDEKTLIENPIQTEKSIAEHPEIVKETSAEIKTKVLELKQPVTTMQNIEKEVNLESLVSESQLEDKETSSEPQPGEGENKTETDSNDKKNDNKVEN
jgi:small subunit ribosomal protein S3